MRDYYQTISDKTLRDEKFLYELTPRGRLMLFTLLLQRRNFPVAVYGTRESIASLSGNPMPFARRGLTELLKAGIIRVGWPRYPVVFFPNWAKYEPQIQGSTGLSWKTLKGWVPHLQRLPPCALTVDVISNVLSVARANLSSKRGGQYVKVLETIELLLEGASHGASHGASQGASHAHGKEGTTEARAASRSASTPRTSGRKEGPKKSSLNPSLHPSPTPSSATLEGEALAFLETWNAERKRQGLSETSPGALTAAQGGQLRALVAQARHQRADATQGVLEQLCLEFHTGKHRPEVLELAQLLRPKAWSWRLDRASLETPRVEAAPAAIPETAAGRIWREVLHVLEQDGKHATLGLMRRLTPVLLEDAELVLECEDAHQADALDTDYREFLGKTVRTVSLELERVRFVVPQGLPGAQREEAARCAD